MGSYEGHSNVSLIVRGKVTRQCLQTTTFEEKGEPNRIRTEVLPLTSLPPYRWAKPAHKDDDDDDRFYIALFSAPGANSLRLCPSVQSTQCHDLGPPRGISKRPLPTYAMAEYGKLKRGFDLLE